MAFGQNGALRLTSPVPSQDGTVFTSEPAISIRGTLRTAGGDRRVRWKSNRGFVDLATVAVSPGGQTVEWKSTVPVPLRPGLNRIEVTALGQLGAAAFLNVYYTPRTPPLIHPLKTAVIDGKQITYEIVDGRAIFQNDIVLGTAGEVARGRLAPHPQAATLIPNSQAPSSLWPIVNGVARVPYAATTVNAANIASAIAESNSQLDGVL